MEIIAGNINLSVDFEKGDITSLSICGTERIVKRVPLFVLHTEDKNKNAYTYSAYDATKVEINACGATYSGFNNTAASVFVKLTTTGDEVNFYIEACPGSADTLIESVEFRVGGLPLLRENNVHGNGGDMLFPYNEGMILSNNDKRARCWFKHEKPEYPSKSTYAIFPNMVCSQMLGYLFDDASLYFAAHDSHRAVKQVDFYAEGDSMIMFFRLYSGMDFGECFKIDYPIVISALESGWQSCAERYRNWFSENLPPRVKKTTEREDLPEWYLDSPLVVAYPVRGWHDMDDMKPNALFPYKNALPVLNEIKEATGSRILALLMHWEGTAPWAPPYVWPPYGGEDAFSEFADALHANGDAIGVYCSGFGYTLRSNLLPYDMTEEYNKRALYTAMCADRDSVPKISKICTGQRSGYDICPASEKGKEILKEAYTPLFKSKIDYAQILDQNHGGGQYLCLSRMHGHPPTPGRWMTDNMNELLSSWNEAGTDKIFGCESAAAEPFIGNLLFNDNRFELNYEIGVPVPLYSYIYHEYIRNFCGNQVCCFFPTEEDTLRYRLAYSYACGDSMTVVLTPEGDFLSGWSTRDFVNLPDREKTLRFIKNLTDFYRSEGKEYLLSGKMVRTHKLDCDTVTYKLPRDYLHTYPALHTSAWQKANGELVQIIINPWDEDKKCTLDGKELTVPALSVISVKI
ncbi:MAG: hypothetical protein IKD45_00440 [Clostridia bacterium]|nr:hypothetical protein [Clostridia bacterium]